MSLLLMVLLLPLDTLMYFVLICYVLVGRVDVIKWLYSTHSDPEFSNVFFVSLQKYALTAPNTLETLNCISEFSDTVSPDDLICECAIYGNIEALDWAVAKGCQIDYKEVLGLAFSYDHPEFLEYFKKKYYLREPKFAELEPTEIILRDRKSAIAAKKTLSHLSFEKYFDRFLQNYRGSPSDHAFWYYLKENGMKMEEDGYLAFLKKKGFEHRRFYPNDRKYVVTAESLEFFATELNVSPTSGDLHSSFLTSCDVSALKWIHSKKGILYPAHVPLIVQSGNLKSVKFMLELFPSECHEALMKSDVLSEMILMNFIHILDYLWDNGHFEKVSISLDSLLVLQLTGRMSFFFRVDTFPSQNGFRWLLDHGCTLSSSLIDIIVDGDFDMSLVAWFVRNADEDVLREWPRIATERSREEAYDLLEKLMPGIKWR